MGKKKDKPLIIKVKIRNPLVIPVITKGVKKHKNKKREAKIKGYND